MSNKFDGVFKEMAEAGIPEEEFLTRFREAQAAAEDEYAKEAWLEEVQYAEEDLVEAMQYYIETIFDTELDDKEVKDIEDRICDCTKVMIKLKKTNDKLESKKDLSDQDAEAVIQDFIRMLEGI